MRKLLNKPPNKKIHKKYTIYIKIIYYNYYSYIIQITFLKQKIIHITYALKN